MGEGTGQPKQGSGPIGRADRAEWAHLFLKEVSSKKGLRGRVNKPSKAAVPLAHGSP